MVTIRPLVRAAIFAVVLAGGLALSTETARAYTWTYCNGSNGDPDADPYDSASDTEALNDCLDMYEVVLLENDNGGGYVGYIVGNSGPFYSPREWGCLDYPWAICYAGLEMSTYNVLAPAGSGGKPRIIAADDLMAPILATDSRSAHTYEIHGIAFDGNRPNRVNPEDCEGQRTWASNVVLFGSNIQVIGIESNNALCGSALEFNEVEDYEVSSSYFGDNGYDESVSGVGPEPWADGLTLNNTVSGVVYYNQFENNTDLGAVIRFGSTVYFAHNDIWNDAAYAFGGLHIQRCDDGCHTWDNDITSDYDLMAFGIVMGLHPWELAGTDGDVGEVYENSIDGAVINMAIDGIDDGDIYDNVLTNPQGSNGFGSCTYSGNLSAVHYGSASIQSGATLSLHWASLSCS